MSTQTGQEHELIESMPLLEWFANNYKKFGATLEIVTDKSQEGSQFVKGFGGIGGKLQKKNVAVLCFFVMSDLIIRCQHKWRTKQMSPTLTNDYTSLRNLCSAGISSMRFTSSEMMVRVRQLSFSGCFSDFLLQDAQGWVVLSSCWISGGLWTAPICMYSCFVEYYALLCRNVVRQAQVSFLKQVDILLISKLICILPSSFKLLFKGICY